MYEMGRFDAPVGIETTFSPIPIRINVTNEITWATTGNYTRNCQNDVEHVVLTAKPAQEGTCLLARVEGLLGMCSSVVS